MRKDTVLCTLGVLVFLMPFAGVPKQSLDIAMFVVGFFIVTLAFASRVERRRRTRTQSASAHIEHNPHPTPDADVRSV